MAQKLNLNRFKSSGVYTVEIDESQNIALPLVTGRLVIGSSKRGPVNTVVALTDLNSAMLVYGEKDLKLEAKGSYFHRTLEVALRRGPVYALNVLPIDNELDKVNFATFNTESAAFNSDLTANAFERPFSSFFNTQKLWFADTEQFNRTKNNSLSVEDNNKIFSMVNLGKRPITVWVRSADLSGYDVTVKEYYKIAGGERVTIPSYLNPDDIVSDYLIEVTAVEGDWTDNVRLSNDPVYKSYFDERGLIISKMNGFLNLREVKLVARVNGSLIPQFKDTNGNDISIDRVLNRLFSQTELFCALDENKIENFTLEELFDNANDESHRIDLAGHGYVDLVNATEQEYFIDEGFNGDLSSANAKIDVLGYKMPVTNTAIYEVTSGANDSCRFVTENGIDIVVATQDSLLYKAWKDGFIVTGNGLFESETDTEVYRYVKIESGFIQNDGKSYIKLKAYSDVTLLNQEDVEGADGTDYIKLSLDIHGTNNTITKRFDFASYLTSNNPGDGISTTPLAINKFEHLVNNKTITIVNGGTPTTTNENGEHLSQIAEFVKPNHYVKAKLNDSSVRDRFLKIVSVSEIPVEADPVTVIQPEIEELGLTVAPFGFDTDTVEVTTVMNIPTGANLIGATISGFGIPSGTTIIGSGIGGFTLSNSTTAPSEVDEQNINVDSFLNNATTIVLDSPNVNIVPGVEVSGFGLAAGTTVTAKAPDGVTLTISPAAQSASSVNQLNITVNAFNAGVGTITLTTANPNILPGSVISGPGIEPGTTVQSIAPGNLIITLSLDTNGTGGQPGDTYSFIKVQGTYDFTKAPETYDITKAEITTETTKFYKKFTVTTLVPSDERVIGVDTEYDNDDLMVFHKGIKNYVNFVKGVKLKGFTLRAAQLPDGTDQRQIDILKYLYENTNIAKTLAEGETVDFRYIIDTYQGDVSANSKYYLARMAADNGQCTAILNAPSFRQFELSTDPIFTDPATNLVSARHISTGGNLDLNPSTRFSFVDEELNGVPMASYAAYFMPNIIINDSGRNKSVPPAAYVANAFMNKFDSGRPFSIVAGKNGVLGDPEIVNLEYELSQEDRDYLEPAGFNLIVRRRGFGIMVFSNNTAYQKMNSALNNLHVREALVTIEKDVERILFNFLFDFNDEITRLRIKTLVEGYLDRVKNAQGIESYRVVFDTTNNGAEVLSANSAIIDIFLDFPRGIHKFINRITITRTGGALASESTGFIPSF